MRDVSDGDYVWGNEWINNFNRRLEGKYIKSGFAPTSGGVMDVDIASGVLGNESVLDQTYAGGSVTIDTEATYDYRIDIISVTTSATVVVTKGTSESVANALPANNVLICAVTVAKGATALTSADIYDARAIQENDRLEVLQLAKSVGATTLGAGASTDITVSTLSYLMVALLATESATAGTVGYEIKQGGSGSGNTIVRFTNNSANSIDFGYVIYEVEAPLKV